MVLLARRVNGIKSSIEIEEPAACREDEDWSDSDKTPSVSSGLEGGNSAVSSPTGQLVDDELVALQPPPPRLGLHQALAPDDIRLKLSVLPTSEDARKRLAYISDDFEMARGMHRGQHQSQSSRPSSAQPDSSPNCSLQPVAAASARLEGCCDDELVSRTDADEGRAPSTTPSSSSSSSLTTTTTRRSRCAAPESDDATSQQQHEQSKRPKLDEDCVTTAPRLRLNPSLATDPALRAHALAALTIKPENAPSPPAQPHNQLSAALHNAIASGRLFVLPSDGKDSSGAPLVDTAPPQPPQQLPGRPTALICPPCGIRFSSASTLDAHQKYYCSHRPRLDADGENCNDDDEDGGKQSTGAGGNNSSTGPASGGANGNNGGSKFDTKKAYACPHCSYSADKKVSLNRHMRMHAASPPSLQPSVVVSSMLGPQAAAAAAAAGVLVPTNLAANGTLNEEAERYCQNCDIRFSSLKTFRAHKTHYCSTRHVVKDGVSSCGGGGAAPSVTPSSINAGGGSAKGSPPTSSSPGDSPPPGLSASSLASAPQPCLALPTNPILIVPYSLVRGASVLAAPGLPAPNTPCFLLPNGTLQPMTRGLAVAGVHPTGLPPPMSQQPMDVGTAPAQNLPPGHLGGVLRAANKPATPAPGIAPLPPHSPNSAASAPLDLSVRKSTPEHEKENRVSPLSQHQHQQAGSPRSRGSASPRAPARPLSQSGVVAGSNPAEIALRLAELAPPQPQPGQLPAGLAQVPGVLVKQGVSRCKECNIVFCRHENFVAHKKHYCQARESGANSPPAAAPHTGSSAAPGSTPSPPLVQLICAACGIKFASMDNLAAHQAFYCPKRPDSQDHLTRCPKCKTVIEAGVAHTCTGGQAGGWRCPVCGAVSPTAGAAQRHMDAHQGVKAFRCTICRYKGNTLRGMRTHIRMHFEKRGADLQEENYITCVLEDELSAPTPEPPPASTPEEIFSAEPQIQQQINGKSEPGSKIAGAPSPQLQPNNRSSSSPLGVRAGDVSPAPSPRVKLEREDTPPPTAVTPSLLTQRPSRGGRGTPAPPNAPSSASVTDDVDPTTTGGQQPNKAGPYYCRSCDISFNYLSTFIAHKKHGDMKRDYQEKLQICGIEKVGYN
ncbi:hypothetical protein QAD02_001834 [Eretmocerus hayati]|uniref:Uncharacterized protein n=1 Tax=Eretmocerus hayati TaxID=131215 RepID=A0ACC2NLZ6_9HYME|nr:hypothetical protein QAD02_001834 [Eretmocerus hayati]